MSTEVAGRAGARPLASSRTLVDRFLAAVPLLSVFLWLCVIYGWEAWDHGTPWLFTDELEMTQLARSIAHTGHAARRDQPYGVHSLYTVLTAPAWWLHTTQEAYSAVKYIGVIAMSLTVFPAYFLARIVASPRASLVAAAGSAAIPALVYSSFVIPEPIAYPWAALCFFLIAKALLTRGHWWIAAAAIASAVAPLVKDALLVVPALYVLAALFVAWSSDTGRRWRAKWSAGDWAGFAALIAVVIVVVSGIASSGSFEYLIMSRYYHGWILRHALWAGGALTIGLGIFPLLAAAGALWPAPGERTSPQLRVYRSILVAAVLLFGLYTGVKGSYNQYSFATRVWERNLTYVAPLLFAGVALWLDRRRVNPVAALAGAGLAVYLVARTPYLMGVRFSSDTPGVAILGQANRSLAFTPADAKLALFVVLVLSLAALLAPQYTRLPVRAGTAVAVVASVFLVAWNLAGEISASAATNSISRTFVSNIGTPTTWLEQHTRGARTLYLGQQMNDQNSEWLLEFWNPSVQEVWSLDGTAQGPGRVQTPDVQSDGNLIGRPPSTARYIVVESGIDPAGTFITRHWHRAGGGHEPWRLYRIDPPLRLLGAATGLYADHWSGSSDSAYTRYASGRGTMRITVSRQEWGGPDKPGHVTIRLGTLAIGTDSQPHIGRVTQIRRWTVHSNEAKTFELPTPAERFRVEVTVDPKFSPHELVPALTDRRELGAVLTYRFAPSPQG